MSKKAKKKSTDSSACKKWVPYKYQEEAVEFCVTRGGAGVFADPGLGKTTIMAAVYKILKRKKMVNRCLVIAPIQACYNVWSKSHNGSDFIKWSDFKDLKINLIHSAKKDEAYDDDADIYVINPEGLNYFVEIVIKESKDGKTRREFRLRDKFRKGKLKVDMLIVDECTDFKHYDTNRSRRLKILLPLFKRRYILTGTPAPNGLLDLFGQIYVIDQGATLGGYITHYKRKFFEAYGYGNYSWRPLPGAKELIYKALSKVVIRIDGDGEVKLPPRIDRQVYLEMDLKTRAIYTEMEKEFILELQSGNVTAANSAVATGKLRQIANGGIYIDQEKPEEKRKTQHLHQVKVEATQKLVEELGGKPALVAYEFVQDLERLVKAFPDAPVLGSGTSRLKSQQIQRDWNAGKISVLLCQPQSMARGLNLQATGRACIWHSLTWNYEHYDQFNRRIWRNGQKEKIYVYQLIMRNTVDHVVFETLNTKKSTQDQLLDALKKRYLLK